MASTMVKMWNGRLYPAEHCGTGNAQLCRLSGEMLSRIAALRRRLDEEQRQLLDEYEERAQEYMELLSNEAFDDGYSLATKIMMESLHRAQAITEE